ncbi:MAG TPA: hypothetical protein VEB68_02350 [Croceibacterium sp.]|nr:hypothetical protein [Croceibacterium sp.]
MKKLLLTSALGAAVLTLAACGDGADDAATDDTAVVDEAATVDTGAATTASADWPAGTRIVEEGGVTYRVDPGGTRVAIDDGSWRIVTEDGVRYRVDEGGTRIRIDDDGLDLDGVATGPDIPGVDVDVGENDQGNLDVDVSTDGTDAD